jgi:hypothetical protein
MSNPQVELHILDHGVITIELDAKKRPNARRTSCTTSTKVITTKLFFTA